MSDTSGKQTDMTGPQHVREALRLADLAEQDHIPLAAGGTYTPTDEQRYRLLMRAHLHANLARTAAMVDAHRFNGGEEHRDADTRRAWHDVFAVSR